MFRCSHTFDQIVYMIQLLENVHPVSLQKCDVFLSSRAIINHFNPKIESYAAVNHISQLSEEQVNTTHFAAFYTPTKNFSKISGPFGPDAKHRSVISKVNLMNFLAHNGKYSWLVWEGVCCVLFWKNAYSSRSSNNFWQRWMTQTLVIVMRHLEQQLLPHTTKLKAHHGWFIAHSSGRWENKYRLQTADSEKPTTFINSLHTVHPQPLL